MNILEMAKSAGNTLPEKYKTMTKEEMENRVHDIKKRLGNRLYIPGHHYQREEVIQFSDSTGIHFNWPSFPRKIVKRIISCFAACISWRKQPIF